MNNHWEADFGRKLDFKGEQPHVWNKNKENPKGDIEIEFVGMRPGEKLYEELLIDAECLKTSHPLIFRALEKSIRPERLWGKLDKLQMAVKNQNHRESIKILSDLVPDWKIDKNL